MTNRHHMITCTPGVQGGYPCIKGTRTPVSAIVEYMQIYGGDIDEVLAALPHLTREQIDAALLYYNDYPELVDEDIARQHATIKEILTVKFDALQRDGLLARKECPTMPEHPMIACTPGVQGGYPCIKGTRTPVSTIVQYYTEIYPGDFERTHATFPHLTREQVEAALQYYAESPELVDEDIATQNEAIKQILTVRVTTP